MYESKYYVEKSSGTFADALLCFGAAYVLRELLRQNSGGEAEVRMVDAGPAYVLELPRPIEEEWLAQCRFFCGAPFLLTPKNRSRLPADLPIGSSLVIEYEAEKERRAEFLALLGGLSKEARRARMQGQAHVELEALQGKGIHEHWDVFRALNPGALDAYNNALAEWWSGRRAFPALLQVMLRLFASLPNDVEGAEKAWAQTCKAHGLPKPKEATAAQVFNPAQGKGQNRSKADGVAMLNLKGFWLLEYLKAVGMYQAGLTRIVANPRDPRNAKDRKTYVLAPREVTFGVHDAIMKEFRQAMAGSATAVKLDVLASLRYTRAFLKYAEETRTASAADLLFGKRPGDLVAGLQMAFYKNLGNSAATMNIAVIGLPGWVRAGLPAETGQLRMVLDEHEQIVRSLDETRSEAYDLLALYREFLSGNDLRPFFAFTTAYSAFYMSQKERGQWCPSFTTIGLEVLLMNTDRPLSLIVQSEGFRNVAYAIRHSTVIPQARKTQGKGGYNVRYGLGQQLARKANYAQDFIAELAEFLHEYNAENEQQYERTKARRRKGVRTSDIEEIVRLVDQYGPKVVCNLLVAYGYAREPWQEDQADTAPETADDVSESNGDEETAVEEE